MPWPAALLELELRQIVNVDLPLWHAQAFNLPAIGMGNPSLAIGPTQRVYVVGSINGRFMGRSARVAAAANTIDLTTHPDPDTWKRVLRVQPNDAIDLELRVILDRADDDPVVLKTLQHRIVAPPDADNPGVGGVDWGVETVQDRNAGDLHYRATVTIVPRGELDAAALVRGIFGSDEGNVLDEGRAVNLAITEVRGLYQPRHPAGALVVPPGGADGGGGLLSGVVPNYKSDDDRGRIFVNQNFAGGWAPDSQQIDLTVTVNFLNVVPAGAEVQWTIVIPDDPTDDQPETHRLAGSLLDHRDYGPSADTDPTRQHLGARSGGDDTEGARSTPLPWVEVHANFAIRNATNTTVISRLEPIAALGNLPASESKVRIHCPDAAGDRLLVRVEFVNPGGAVACPDQTGIMAMWSRIYLDYYRMALQGPVPAALPLPVDRLPRHFEAAFVQLDVMAEVALVGVNSVRYIGNSANYSLAASTYCTNHFAHGGRARYFCLISAKEPYPLPPNAGGAQQNNAPATIVREGLLEAVDVEGAYDADAPGDLTVRWNAVGGAARAVGFSVRAQELKWFPKRRRLWLAPHDVQDQFTGHDSDGSLRHAYRHERMYFPRGCISQSTGVAPAWIAPHPGYDAPQNIAVDVRARGGFYVSGISPTVTVHGRSYFAGRTMLFTHHGVYFDHVAGTAKATAADALESTIVHELTHAFGMPHKCAKHDTLTPRRRTCCMNYSPNWMTNDHDNRLAPGTSGRVGPRLCARHILAIRRVHLEDNGGLNW